MRNILAHLPAKGKAKFAQKLKQIWLQPDVESAKAFAKMVMDDYEDKYPAAIEILESGLEDSLQFYNFDRIDLEKYLQQIYWKGLIEKYAGAPEWWSSQHDLHPPGDLYLIEYSEDWSTDVAISNQN